MPFSEVTKLEVKRKAAFCCCRCHEISVEVHHIIPQESGGGDHIDNAAPLCPNCHNGFGANPEKRKEIRQMRDWWYEVVAEKYSRNEELLKKLQSLDESLANFQKDNKENRDSIEKILQSITDLNQLSKINNGDDIAIAKSKATTTFSLSSVAVSRRVYCPFCRKDIAAELELAISGITGYYVSAKTPKFRIMDGLPFPTLSRADDEDILFQCPYCVRQFNLKNAIWANH